MDERGNTLYLHIGKDKTGSTAIQSLLRNNESVLPAFGLAYLSGWRKNSHSPLRLATRDGNLDGWHDIAQELSSIRARGIVSDEGLYHLSSGTWSEIQRILAPHRIEIIVYLRRQSEMVCSGIPQRLKGNDYKKLPGEYALGDLIAIGQHYSRLLDTLAGVFGRAHVHAARYEPSGLHEGNLFLDFFRKAGVELDKETLAERFQIQARDPNPTLDVDAIDLLTRFEKNGIDPQARKTIVKLLARHGRADHSTFVTEAQIRAIDNHFRADNNRVARDWFAMDRLFHDPCRFRFREVDEQNVARYLGLITEQGLWPKHRENQLAPSPRPQAVRQGRVTLASGAMRRDRDEENITMIVCCQSPWHPANSHHTEQYGDVEYVFNRFHPDAIAVVDVKWPKSSLSALFPPERRVWVHIEPIRLTDYFRGFEQYYAGGIISWHAGLEHLPQTRQYRHGQRGGGCRDSDAGKIFGIGGHISAKDKPPMEGYRLRREILAHEDEIRIPSTVFNCRGRWQGVAHDYPRKTTDEVMDYMFHLTIENCRERHYFTEKIIRAFANFCVPLYHGDPCIDEEFDMNGIILIDKENWLDTINSLTPSDYYDRLESVRRNYFLSMKYWTKLDRIVALVNTTPALRQPVDEGGILGSARVGRNAGLELVESAEGYELQERQTGRRIASCNVPAAAVYTLSDGIGTIADIAAEITASLEGAELSSIADDVATGALELVRSGALHFAADPQAPMLIPEMNRDYTLRQTADGYLLESGATGVSLNPPAALVWALCDGSRSLEEIIDHVVEATGGSRPESIARDICQTIMGFSDRGQVVMGTKPGKPSGRIRSGWRADAGRRPRILYLLTRFPQLSETYIKTEIAALRDEYDIGVITFEDSNLRYANHHPYQVVRVRGNTMEDGFEESGATLTQAVRDFDPDILHTHYLHNVPIASTMARTFGIPFTVRAHSYDVMARGFRLPTGDGRPEPGAFLLRHFHLINDEHCLGVLTFPYTVPAFSRAGVRDHKVIPCMPIVDFSAFYDRGPNEEGFLNVEPCLPKKAVTDFIDLAGLMPGHRYSLYGMGHRIAEVREYNQKAGSPVVIEDTVEPEAMPAVYKRHNWLIYTASFTNGNVGWPVAVGEAQAAGLGVCVANVHPHVADQLGGAGFVYDSIQEIPAIVSRPYPDDMREAGFENARKSDVHRHKHLLTGLWQSALAPNQAPTPGERLDP